MSYVTGLKRDRQLMSNYERSVNSQMIESYQLNEGGAAIPDAYTYSKNRVPSRDLRDKPELQKELLIKDLDYFKHLMSPAPPQSSIGTVAVPTEQTRRHYKSFDQYSNNLGTSMRLAPEAPEQKRGGNDLLDFAQPVVDHKFYKNRILSKRSHIF